MNTGTTLPTSTEMQSPQDTAYAHYSRTADAVWGGDPQEPDRFYDPTRPNEKET